MTEEQGRMAPPVIGLVGLAILLTACATPYQPRGVTGGFSETRLDSNTFRIDFKGNGFTSRERVEVYLLRRAAEVTLAHGFDYFVVIDAGTERKDALVTTPGSYTATTTGSAYRVGSTAYGTAITTGVYTPGVTVPITKYGASSVIQVFRGAKPAGVAGAFEARDVLHYAGGPSTPRLESPPAPAPGAARAPVLASAPATGSSPPVAAVAPAGLPAVADATRRGSMSGQDQEEGRAVVARAKAEAYRRLDQLEVAQASPDPSPAGTVAPAPTRAASVFSGTSGSVAWEVTAVEQNRNGGGTIIQWNYEIALREREGRSIQFETLEVGSEGRNVTSAPRTFPFSRRLDPRGEIRYQDSYRIELFVGGTASFGNVPGGREGVRLFLRFQGRVDTGASVRVDIRFSLDQSLGEQPRVTADATPLPGSRALKPDELHHLAGGWTGYLLDGRGFTFALEVQVRPDGQFNAVVGTSVKQPFQGTLAISPAGELEFTTRNVSGRATIHEVGPQRILVAAATPKPGAATAAIPYSLRVRFVGPPPAIATPVIAAVPTAAPSAPPTVVAVPPADEVLTNESILSMVKANLDESVILAKIAATPARFDTRTDALIELKRAGVPDRVLAAMVGK